MKQVATFSLLLIVGLIGAPLLPEVTGDYFSFAEKAIKELGVWKGPVCPSAAF